MRCDEAQLQLTSEDDSVELSEHLDSCPDCAAFAQQTRALLADAALPAVSAAERAALAVLATSAHRGWGSRQRRRHLVRRVASLAMAACLGAAVASAALLPRASVTSVTSVTSLTPAAPTAELEWPLPMLTQNEAASPVDDELEFEVLWPTAEGDVP